MKIIYTAVLLGLTLTVLAHADGKDHVGEIFYCVSGEVSMSKKVTKSEVFSLLNGRCRTQYDRFEASVMSSNDSRNSSMDTSTEADAKSYSKAIIAEIISESINQSD
jgi:hypothetical protein